MSGIKSFTDLVVWQKAHELVLTVYKSSDQFPKAELFGITGQMRRASVSVVSNIVEGFERKSPNEFRQFLSVSRGSLAEVQCQSLIARDLQYLSDADFQILADKAITVHKLLNAFIKSINDKDMTKD